MALIWTAGCDGETDAGPSIDAGADACLGDGCPAARIDGGMEADDGGARPDVGPPREDAAVADAMSPDGAAITDGAPEDADLTRDAAPAEDAAEDAAVLEDAAVPEDAAMPEDAAVGDCEPGDSRECGRDVGRCRAGLQVCTPEGEWSPCRNAVGPIDEVCNGEDDDCDGRTDEGDPGGGQRCEGELAGPCAEGRTACVGGELVCRGHIEPAEEICNGVDDDCDGRVDEVPVFHGEPQVASATGETFHSQRLYWLGGAFVLTWNEPGEGVYVARMVEGRLGAPRRMDTADEHPLHPAVGWNGAAYAAVWHDRHNGGRELFSRPIAADGVPAGAVQRITSDAGHVDRPELLWTGESFVALWTDVNEHRFRLRLRRLGADGRPFGQTVTVHDNYLAGAQAMVWNGRELAVAFTTFDGERSFVELQRYDADLQPLGQRRAFEGAGGTPSEERMVWNGEGYGLVFTEPGAARTDLWFMRLAADGRPLTDPIRVTRAPADAITPQVFWIDGGYSVVWLDNRDGRWRVWHARLDADGARLGEDVPVTDGQLGPTSGEVAVAWSGEEFAVSWLERGNDERPRLMVAHGPLGCP